MGCTSQIRHRPDIAGLASTADQLMKMYWIALCLEAKEVFAMRAHDDCTCDTMHHHTQQAHQSSNISSKILSRTCTFACAGNGCHTLTAGLMRGTWHGSL